MNRKIYGLSVATLAAAAALTCSGADTATDPGLQRPPDASAPNSPSQAGEPDTIVLSTDDVRVSNSDWVFVSARALAKNGLPPDGQIAWKITDESIAWYSRLGDTIVSVWGKKPGATTLTASIGKKSTTIPLEVTPENVGGVYVQQRVIGVGVGSAYKVATYSRTAAGNEARGPLTWTSSDPSIATVSSDGAILGQRVGSTSIHVTAGSQTADIVVHVPTEFSAVTAAKNHSCALKVSGAMVCWGANDFGQLGRGSASSFELPEIVELPVRFVDVHATSYATCGRTQAGDVYCWGSLVGNSLASERVEFPEPAKQFTSGSSHICALSITGKVYCYGHSLASGAARGIVAQPSAAIPAPVPFISIVAGASHTCALAVGGDAYCWGDDDFGQLGDSIPEQTPGMGRATAGLVAGGHKFTAIFAGSGGYHTCGVTHEGSNYCWGEYVESNTAPTTTRCRTLPPDSGGVTLCSPIPVRMTVGTTLTSITTAWNSGCGLDPNGALYCWGQTPDQDYSSQLARRIPELVNVQPRFTDLSFGFDHICALSVDKLVYCWGHNQSQQSGQDFQTYVVPPPIIVYGLARVSKPTLIASP